MMTWQADLAASPRVVHAWPATRWTAPMTTHHLEGLWQLHVYDHGGTLTAEAPAGRLVATLAPGTVTLLPPGTRSRYQVPGRPRFSCLHLALPVSAPPRAVAAVAVDDPLVADLIRLTARQADAAGAAALAWAALWRLASAAKPGEGLVAQACALLEERLEDPPEVPRLARRLGCSAAHLRRLFQREFGVGVVPWCQRRRAERAQHLLRHSDRPLGEVAMTLGFHDASHFTKFVRRYLGSSPRQVRAGSGDGQTHGGG